MEWSLRWKSCEHGPLSPRQYSRDVPRGSDLGWQGDGHSSPSTPFMRITPVVAYACVKDDNCTTAFTRRVFCGSHLVFSGGQKADKACNTWEEACPGLSVGRCIEVCASWSAMAKGDCRALSSAVASLNLLVWIGSRLTSASVRSQRSKQPMKHGELCS